jgi:hypothetical protein
MTHGEGPAPYDGDRAGPTPTSAAFSLVLGIASLVCFGPLAGVPAVLLGRSAVREIDASDGVLGGRRVARAGIVTGAVGTVLSTLALLALIWYLGQGSGFPGRLDDS